MTTITATVYIQHNGTEYECEVEVEATVSHGGSNSYGSDEPAWTEVEDVTVYNSRGKRVSKRMMDKIESQCFDYICERLAEADSSW